MTLTDHIPGLKTTARHRGKSGLQLQRELAAAERRIAALTAGIDQISAERNQLEAQLDEAGIELSGARHDLQAALNGQKRLNAALRAWEARWANAHPVNVPAPRDVRADDDRPTAPQGIDVSSLRAIHRIVPQPAAPDATNPANIPAA